MQPLRDLAGRLLAEGTVGVVIGYEEGPRGVRPVFVRKPEEVSKLVFDARCVQNLAAYLSPRRPHLRGLGKPAVVLKGCDTRAVATLLRESQLKREDVVLIGVRCGGVGRGPACSLPLTPETVADRCAGCDAREPRLHDHVVGEPLPEPPVSTRRDQQLAALEKLSPKERWDFWQAELSRCVRCHACRQVCPLCVCERCVADKSRPQWIESSPHPRGNFSWIVTRSMHLAGRCADCGECERVCPAGIPLTLIARSLARSVEARFGYRASDDPTVAAPIGTYQKDDPQEFIR